VVLWEVYAGGVVVVRELLLIRQCGQGSWEVEQLNYEEETQQMAAGSSTGDQQQVEPEGVSYYYREGRQKKWFTAAPKNPGNGQRLALQVSLGWEDLDTQQQEQAGCNAASFAVKQAVSMRQELAICQLAAAGTPNVASVHGVGSIHMAPGMPVGAAAVSSGVAPAAAAAAGASTTVSSLAPSVTSPPPVAAPLQQQEPVQQLGLWGLVREMPACTLHDYIRQPYVDPGPDPLPEELCMGLRHTPQQLAEAKDLLCQVIRGVRRLERLNILHRHIRASSILLYPAPPPPPPPPAAAAAASGPAAGPAAAPRTQWLAKLSGFSQAFQTSTLQPRANTPVGSPRCQPPEMQDGHWYDEGIHSFAVRP
jgi:hypothetical protein